MNMAHALTMYHAMSAREGEQNTWTFVGGSMSAKSELTMLSGFAPGANG